MYLMAGAAPAPSSTRPSLDAGHVLPPGDELLLVRQRLLQVDRHQLDLLERCAVAQRILAARDDQILALAQHVLEVELGSVGVTGVLQDAGREIERHRARSR